MTDFEFVDAHLHHWRPSVDDWYPMLRETMPDLHRDYLPEDYRADAGAARVTGAVHVTATTAPRAYLDETRWIDAMHRETGWPSAIIGTVDPASSWAEIERDVMTQADSPAFRGVRVLFGFDPAAGYAGSLFRLMGRHEWVYDLVTHPAEVESYLPAVAAAADTAFVLEHAGWPDGGEPGQFREWRDGLAKLAALDNVDCKISGLPMALGTMEEARLRPFVESCLELFGVDRCLFGSNFPIEKPIGSYETLLGAYRGIASGLDAADRHKVFAANARRRYRC